MAILRRMLLPTWMLRPTLLTEGTQALCSALLRGRLPLTFPPAAVRKVTVGYFPVVKMLRLGFGNAGELIPKPRWTATQTLSGRCVSCLRLWELFLGTQVNMAALTASCLFLVVQMALLDCGPSVALLG